MEINCSSYFNISHDVAVGVDEGLSLCPYIEVHTNTPVYLMFVRLYLGIEYIDIYNVIKDICYIGLIISRAAALLVARLTHTISQCHQVDMASRLTCL